MILKYRLSLFFIFCLCGSLLHAQKPKLNATDESGQRTGFWILKDKKERPIAKGLYEAGQRIGEWKFYLSPVSRYTTEPDMIGHYEEGKKQGQWTFTESRSKTTLVGNFENDEMNGQWKFLNIKGKMLLRGDFELGKRQGEWVVFQDEIPIAVGEYDQSKKTGQWIYDYYIEDSATHVIGRFDYSSGKRQGDIEFYKVEKHPSFGTNEFLVGTGGYLHGKKTGRWIEYNKGLKGEFIETGFYDGTGQRTGLWECMVNDKTYQQCGYNDGLRHGSFKSYYIDGTLKYTSAFDQGLEHGYFTAYYPDGSIKEKGAYTINEKEEIIDTLFYKIKLPIEYAFQLIDTDFENLNYNAIKWIEKIDHSLEGEIADERFEEFLTYGRQAKLRVEGVERRNKHVVRVGKYELYHENGQLNMEGKYAPSISVIKDPSTGTIIKDFAKDGVWKEYDDLGYLQRTYRYNKGELVEALDSKGKPIKTTN